MTKKIINNASWLIAGEAISGFFIFILNLIAARMLGIDEFGKFSYAISVIFLLGALVDFGLVQIFIRDLSRDSKLEEKYFFSSIYIRIFAVFALMGIFLVFEHFKSSGIPFYLFLILLVYLLINSINELLRAILKAREWMKAEAVLKIFERFILLVFGCLAITIWRKYDFLILAYLATSLLLVVILYRKIFSGRKIKKSVTISDSTRLIKRGWAIGLGGAFVTIYASADLILIKNILNSDSLTAIYAASYKFLSLAITLISLISIAYMPQLAKMKDNKKYTRLIRNYLLSTFFASLLLFSAILFFSSFIMNIIYGNSYIAGANVLIILAISLLFIGAREPFTYLLILHDRQKYYMASVLSAAIFNIVTNIYVIPSFGIIGAAWVTVGSEALLLILTMYFYFLKEV
ncbi:MAG: Polysaccharide biosynthesis protein [candidate division CPR2 bacterium GW2011_GWC1_39_9]|uniref:Polysaccharide biosynthesis protein n=1 Tax=candidate division CPR2 bacterium GW2011_GWC2_39_10 TaxID=1618345 RepID=A0A0G0P9B7_UNCC2|nr:MAG: Polysaccharide biosynthesis protein [candidate division CPR2 bacterium GW2011_GWC2_39_10]KKR35422.1 MAG: Polysaccharide biosynthesis protein [candidate division CPR2 bacterium GW2011_GWC1_39_9]